MSDADLALALTALLMLALRLTGVLLAGAMRPEHPFIAWAAMVSQATLAALVALAIAAPAGVLAQLPLAARLGGVAVGVGVLLAARERLLPALGAGLAAMLLLRLLLA